MAWLIRQKAGTAKLYLTMRGSYSMDLNSARQFPDAVTAREVLGKRSGKVVAFWLDANNNPAREVAA